MRFEKLFLAGFVSCALVVNDTTTLAGQLGLSSSYQAISPGGKYVFVMVSPSPVAEDAQDTCEANQEKAQEIRRTRGAYSQSSLYRNDGCIVPLWVVSWYASSVELASDGVHLVRHGPRAACLEDEALSFFANGKLLRTYKLGRLVDDPDLLPRDEPYLGWPAEAQSSFDWLAESQLDNDKLTYTLGTGDGNRFVFDLRNGRIVDSSRPGLVRKWLLWSAPLVVLLCLLAGGLRIGWETWRENSSIKSLACPPDRRNGSAFAGHVCTAIVIGLGFGVTMAIHTARWWVATSGRFFLDRDYPWGEPYCLYAPEFLLAGVWFGYCLSGGNLLRSTGFVGAILGHGVARQFLFVPAFPRWVLPFIPGEPHGYVYETALIGLATVPFVFGELSGSAARKAIEIRRRRRRPTSTETPRRIQLGLANLLALVTLCCTYFVQLTWYGPACIDLSCQAFSVDRNPLDAILDHRRPIRIDKSDYQSITINAEELGAVTCRDGIPIRPSFSDYRQIRAWPSEKISVPYTCLEPIAIASHTSVLESFFADSRNGVAPPTGSETDSRFSVGQLWRKGYGFFCVLAGCRRSGPWYELSFPGLAEFRAWYVLDDANGNRTAPLRVEMGSCNGYLKFRGRIPTDYLVFFAPIGKTAYHLVVVKARLAPIQKPRHDTT